MTKSSSQHAIFATTSTTSATTAANAGMDAGAGLSRRAFVAGLAGLAGLLLAPTFLMTGCSATGSGDAATSDAGAASGADDEGELDLAVVVGAHSNAKVVDSGAIKGLVERCVRTHGLFDVIVCDGSPATALPGGAERLGSDRTHAGRLADDIKAITANAIAAIDAAVADVPEYDLLGAVESASRSLSAGGGHKVIAFLGTAVPTAGALDYAHNPDLLAASAQDAVSALRGAGMLPRISADEVQMYFSFDFADPQEEPTPATKEALKAQVEAVLVAAGAGTVSWHEEQPLPRPYEGLPQVSVVNFPKTEVVVESTIDLTGEEVGFVPDTAQLVDEAAASAAVAGIAARMAEDTALRAYVTGSCAGGARDPEGVLALSEARAQTVADLISGHGIDPSRLIVEGVGSGTNDRITEHFPDTDAQGQQIEGENAQRNRRVVVTLVR